MTATSCGCGRHFYHHATQAWCARLASGIVVLKPHAWPECVRIAEEERFERSELPTKVEGLPGTEK
jgi:hypothetical protein